MFYFVFVTRMIKMMRAFLRKLVVDDDVFWSNVFGNLAPSSNDISATCIGALSFLESYPIDMILLDNNVLSLALTGGNTTSGTITVSTAMDTMNKSDRGDGSHHWCQRRACAN